MRNILIVLSIISIFFLFGCEGQVTVWLNDAIVGKITFSEYEGVVANETDYTVKLIIKDLSESNSAISVILTLAPGEQRNIELAEKRYRFTFQRAYSGERITSQDMHLNAIKKDSEYLDKKYDWMVILKPSCLFLQPRIETHP